MKKSYKSLPSIPVESAYRRIRKYIRKTPVEFCFVLSHETGGDIHFKMENWQKTGSFKLRGALNKMLMLTGPEKKKGIITASAGNHALGVAYAADLLGIKARVVLPVNASIAKVRKLRYFGCEIIQAGEDYDEAEDVAHQIEKDCNLSFVHAFDDRHIIAGQGTIARELFHQLEKIDVVVVPIGGGGLIGGISSYMKNRNTKIKVIGLQPAASPAMKVSSDVGKVIETPMEETLADGLAGRFVSDLTLKLTQTYVDEIVVVEENEIREAIKFLVKDAHILVEGAAAVGVAAILANKINVADKQVAIVLTGMGADGREGARVLKAQGSEIWAQDEESCVVYGMPAAIVDAGLADNILDIHDVAQAIVKRI